MKFKVLAAFAAAAVTPLAYAISAQTYTWKNVKIGGGGGFVPGIVFNPKEKAGSIVDWLVCITAKPRNLTL